jgi:hypothetical protein
MLNILIAQLTITYERVISNMEAHGTHCFLSTLFLTRVNPYCFGTRVNVLGLVQLCACACACAWCRTCACVRVFVYNSTPARAHLDLNIEGFLPLGLIQLTTTSLFVAKLLSSIEGPSATPSLTLAKR